MSFGWRGLEVFAALVAAAALVGCASPGPEPIEFETGPRAEVTAEGLHRVKNPRYRDAWARPDVDFAGYDRIQLLPVEIRHKGNPTARVSDRSVENDFALGKSQKQELAGLFLEVFTSELEASPYLQLVAEAGPRVLRVEASIIDLVVQVPTEVRGNERTFTRSTAEMTLLLELYDASSGEILARLSDRREALGAGHGASGNAGDLYYSNPATNTAAMRRSFRRWAQILRQRLDELHELEALGS
ncbi:MAG: DUF3313 family protein [Deltaproteobacteria bacterium]|nr:DUF3313 family protein [Deltaproteobacteria bacterium]MBW2421174.1 DUF3313 family protein [Deltaproteobacteria bacterium]